MKKITPAMVRDKCTELNIHHRTVWEACDLNQSWFIKMIMDNDKYRFKNPNPEWMEKIWSFLYAHEKFYKGMDAKFLKYWKGLK